MSRKAFACSCAWSTGSRSSPTWRLDQHFLTSVPASGSFRLVLILVCSSRGNLWIGGRAEHVDMVFLQVLLIRMSLLLRAAAASFFRRCVLTLLSLCSSRDVGARQSSGKSRTLLSASSPTLCSLHGERSVPSASLRQLRFEAEGMMLRMVEETSESALVPCLGARVGA